VIVDVSALEIYLNAWSVLHQVRSSQSGLGIGLVVGLGLGLGLVLGLGFGLVLGLGLGLVLGLVLALGLGLGFIIIISNSNANPNPNPDQVKPVIIPGSLLTKVTYTITLTIKNFLGLTSSKSLNIVVNDDPNLPTLSIIGGSSLNILASSPLTIQSG
jgi:hypothetical protein